MAIKSVWPKKSCDDRKGYPRPPQPRLDGTVAGRVAEEDLAGRRRLGLAGGLIDQGLLDHPRDCVRVKDLAQPGQAD
jgi:hypothetical protein